MRSKAQQTFKNERQNVFTEEINKIALGPNDDKRIQSIDLIETYAYGTSKDLISEKKEIKCNNIITLYKKMMNFDDVGTKKNIPNWPEILDYSHKISIMEDSGFGKTNSLFNLINHQPDIDKIYLYAKNPYEAK